MTAVRIVECCARTATLAYRRWRRLHDREVLEQQLAMRRRAGRNAEAAITDHGGRDAQRRRRRERRIPGGLCIVVRVHVDEARREREPARVHRLARGLVERADLCHATVAHPDVHMARRTARAVIYRSATNREIKHRGGPLD
jgi:hypothetical protein